MNMMRHLKVPNSDVEGAFTKLKENNWLASNMLIFASENGKNRLIPLNNDAPEMPNNLLKYREVNCKGKIDNRVNPNWLNHLKKTIDNEIIEKYDELWPASHEFIGDMMIVRIDEEIIQFSSKIAKAKLDAHPKLRLILSDQGVFGELRIRELIPIGVRNNNQIILENIPLELCKTKVIVKESGREIICDPSIAYFSSKLQTERQETLYFAKKLKKILGRPINICDPFCGVGPAVSSLLNEPNLTHNILASDLNPEAVNILFENLSKWDKRKYPEDSGNIDWMYPNRLVGVADATVVAKNKNYIGKWDLLMINLPHKTLELLPYLLPLIDNNSPSLIRGRIIIEESKIEYTNKILHEILPDLLPGSKSLSLKIKRDYSAKLRLCSFEAWLA
jgi:tRNA G37 N-methylase Trm5